VICGKAGAAAQSNFTSAELLAAVARSFSSRVAVFQFPPAELLIRGTPSGSLNNSVSTHLLRECIQALKRPELRGRENKNALDGFCHSATSLAFGLGVPRCRKLGSLDPGHCSGCTAG
jgi:hypothetical protein